MTRIEEESAAAVATRNSTRNRRAARSRIEAAAAANAAAAQAAAAAGEAMGELYANRLIACLDAEGLGADLDDDALQAVLVIVRKMTPAPLPQRRPDGNGTGPQRQLDGNGQQAGQRMLP